MYSLIGWIVVIVLSPILVPLGLYAGLTYHWTDTVPSDEALDYESEV